MKVKPPFCSWAVLLPLPTVTLVVAVRVFVLTEFVAVNVPVLTDVSPVSSLASLTFRPSTSFTTPMLLSVKSVALVLPPLMVKVSPSFLATVSLVSPWKVMPLLILAASMVTSLNLLMAFVASLLRPTVYSSILAVLLTVILFSPVAVFTVVVLPPFAFLAIFSTALSCATLTASVSSLPAPRLVILRRMVLPLVVSPIDNAPTPVALALVRSAPVGV